MRRRYWVDVSERFVGLKMGIRDCNAQRQRQCSNFDRRLLVSRTSGPAISNRSIAMPQSVHKLLFVLIPA